MLYRYLIILLIPIAGFAQTQIGSDIDGKIKEDFSGHSVSLSSDGKILALAGINKLNKEKVYCYARVFKNIDNNWVQFNDDIIGESTDKDSEVVVKLSKDGKTLAIGFSKIDLKLNRKTCYVSVYNIEFDKWKQVGKNIWGDIKTTDFTSIALSENGSIIAIASQYYDGNIGMSANPITIYKNVSNNWVNISSNIKNKVLGTRVELSSDGKTIAIGNHISKKEVKYSGEVTVFRLNSNSIWKQIGKTFFGSDQDEMLGASISLSSNGEILAISSPFKKLNLLSIGEVNIYKQVSNEWKQIGNTIHGNEIFEHFGICISISSNGSRIAIGRPYFNVPSVDSGGVDIYQIDESLVKWVKYKKYIYGEDRGNLFGYSLALSADGNIVAVGAPSNSGNYYWSGNTSVYDFSK